MGTFSTNQFDYDEYMRQMYQSQRGLMSIGLATTTTGMANMVNMAAPKEVTPNKVLLLCK